MSLPGSKSGSKAKSKATNKAEYQAGSQAGGSQSEDEIVSEISLGNTTIGTIQSVQNLGSADQQWATSTNAKQSGLSQRATSKNNVFTFFSETKDVPDLEIVTKGGIIVPKNTRAKVGSWKFLDNQNAVTKHC